MIVLERDFGFSVSNNIAVSSLISRRIMTTLLLGVYAITLALLIAVPLAVHQAVPPRPSVRPGRQLRRRSCSSPCRRSSSPSCSSCCSSSAGVFPRIAERVYPWDDLGQHVRNFTLPALTLALPAAAVLTRLLRADLVLVAAERLRASSPRPRASRRGASCGATPCPTRCSRCSAPSACRSAVIVGGAVVVETFFDLDGMGLLLVVAVLSSDLFTVQAIVALLVVAVVVTNLVIDLLYGVIDPRVRLASELR